MKNFADQGKAESKMTVSSLFQNNSLQAQNILTSMPSSHVQNTCFFLRVFGCEGMFRLAYMLWQGAKKVIFITSPKVISTSLKKLQFFCNLNSPPKITCPSGKLGTEFTSPIAKSTSPRLSDTTFFAHCCGSILSLVQIFFSFVLGIVMYD